MTKTISKITLGDVFKMLCEGYTTGSIVFTTAVIFGIIMNAIFG